mmetsp:Transcript_7837/g.27525  ORF Transcript_7837/g.27525 Transcript_7837/m.27525 type:complete len:350 (-) Transcript_7837:292-1341(-)
MKVFFFGDSHIHNLIPWSSFETKDDDWVNIRFDIPGVEGRQRRGTLLSTSKGHIEVVAFSVYGASMSGICKENSSLSLQARLKKELQSERPDICFLHFGAVDNTSISYFRSIANNEPVTEEDMIRPYLDLVKRLRREYDISVCGVPLPAFGRNSGRKFALWLLQWMPESVFGNTWSSTICRSIFRAYRKFMTVLSSSPKGLPLTIIYSKVYKAGNLFSTLLCHVLPEVVGLLLIVFRPSLGDLSAQHFTQKVLLFNRKLTQLCKDEEVPGIDLDSGLLDPSANLLSQEYCHPSGWENHLVHTEWKLIEYLKALACHESFKHRDLLKAAELKINHCSKHSTEVTMSMNSQ